MDEKQTARSQVVKVMKVKTWDVSELNAFPLGKAQKANIHISDDEDHVGTVQYSLTDSSCVEVSSLPSMIKDTGIVDQKDAYTLCDGFQGIMDVAQLSEERKRI